MIDEQAIKARCDAATPGPWISETYGFTGKNWLVGSVFTGSTHETSCLVHITTDHLHASEYTHGEAISDVDFIAHAREDVPALLAEVERLRGEVERLKTRRVDIASDGSIIRVW